MLPNLLPFSSVAMFAEDQSDAPAWRELRGGQLKDGAQCKIIGGTHKGKARTVRDQNGKDRSRVYYSGSGGWNQIQELAKNVAIS
jgi:hypothetical protein